jgi:hypothetical protein
MGWIMDTCNLLLCMRMTGTGLLEVKPLELRSTLGTCLIATISPHLMKREQRKKGGYQYVHLRGAKAGS